MQGDLHGEGCILTAIAQQGYRRDYAAKVRAWQVRAVADV